MDDSRATATVHDALVAELGPAIVHGRLLPGARVLTVDLAQERGVSRSAAREAVRVLESLGLVQVRRKSGVEVRPRQEWNLFAPEVIAWRLAGPGRDEQLVEISQLRSAVEPLAASLAAVSASTAQKAEMLALVVELEQHDHEADRDAYLAADIRFHRLLLEASGNAMLSALGETVESVLRGRTTHDLMPHVADPRAVQWHRDAVSAIERGEAEGAAAAMRHIVSEAGEAMQRAGV